MASEESGGSSHAVPCPGMRSTSGSRPGLSQNKVQPDWIVKAAVVVLGAGLAFDQVRVVLSYGRFHTDEDQTILWYAGRQLLGGHVHEPNFFGQRYNTTFEALPGGILHGAGLPWGTALPVATTLLVTAAWVSVAIAAYRRGRPVATLLALAAPYLMRLQYLLLLDAPRGVMAGDFSAALALAIAVGARRYQIRLCALVTLGGLAILWENAAALVVIPALLYVVSTDWFRYRRRVRHTLLLVATAAVPPLAWLLFTIDWWHHHVFYLTYPSPSMRPQWAMFARNFHHLAAYFSFFAPTLAPVADIAVGLLLAGFVFVIVFAIRRRSVPLLLASCSLLVLIFLALNSTSAVEPGLYLAGSRVLLPLPFAIWFLAFGVLDTAGAPSRLAAMHTKLLVTAIVALSVVSLIVTQVAFTNVSNRAISSTVGVSVTNPVLLSTRCTELSQLYTATHAQLLASNDRNVAYGCAAERGFNTLIPDYDRRGWLIRASQQKPLRRLLVAVPNCGYVVPAGGRCEPEPAGVVLVQTRPQPPAQTLDHIRGMHVMSGLFVFF
jgi:hypothetical protein